MNETVRRVRGSGIAGVLAGWALLGGCAGSGVEGAQGAAAAPAGADETAPLYEAITRLVAPAACRSDSECRTLALGSKPCGGPESYLAWSTVGTDARALEAAAARYRDARRVRHERLGLMSDCAIVPEPAVRCVLPAAAASGSLGQCRTQALPPGARPGLR